MLNITVPTAVVDLDKVRKNIRRMKQRLDKAGVGFRPLFKTHQSWKIAEIFSQEGIGQITVSSATMAYYFAQQGWKDITIAFPLNLREIDNILRLPEDVVVGLLISDIHTASFPFPESLLKKSVFWIELDTGHHRSGLSVADFCTITQVIDKLCNKGAHLQGFLFHDGHTYNAAGVEEIRQIRYHTFSRLSLLREFLCEKYPGQTFLFSGGDTPSCSHDLPLEGINEMRPGNFVFYDLQQLALGSCQPEDIALSVLCPVVTSYPDQGRAVIYGGSIHLSKDKLIVGKGTIYGVVCSEEKQSVMQLTYPGDLPLVTTLSQEHGVITGTTEQILNLLPGSLARVIPVHSCLVVSNMKQLVSTDGTVFETLNLHSFDF